jgi:hypothetical protein
VAQQQAAADRDAALAEAAEHRAAAAAARAELLARADGVSARLAAEAAVAAETQRQLADLSEEYVTTRARAQKLESELGQTRAELVAAREKLRTRGKRRGRDSEIAAERRDLEAGVPLPLEAELERVASVSEARARELAEQEISALLRERQD